MISFAYSANVEQETAEGKLLVDAAKAANVKLLIWSGLPDVTGLTGGKYKNVFLCDDKAEVTRYAKSIGIPFVSVEAGGYMQNYLDRTRPRKEADGSFVIYSAAVPDVRLPLIDTNGDYGLFVRKAIEQPAESGTVIHAFSEQRSHNEIVETLSKGECRSTDCHQSFPPC